MIYGERVRLRAIERSDLSKFVEWMNDPEVIAGLMISLPMSFAEEEGWYEGVLKHPAAERPYGIEIRKGDEWILVGSCGFHAVNWRERSGDLGISIGAKEYWNQGYGTEVMRLLLQHGFNTLNLNRIALEVFENNPRAIRAYEKAGFVHEGRKRQGMYKDGRYIDILLMSVLRSEWQSEDPLREQGQ